MRSLLRSALALTALALAVACGSSESTSSGASGGGKKVIVGTNPDYPPMQFIDPKTNEMVGYEIELMEAIAEKGGFEMEWKNIEWKSIFGALEAGDIDAIMSAATITDERKQKFDFSDPYYTISQRVVVLRENAPQIQKVDDLNGKRIGVQLGTTGQLLVEKEYPSFVRVTFDNAPLAFQDLAGGGVFGFMVDEPVAEEYGRANPEMAKRFEALPFKFSEESYGVVLRKNETELRDKINAGLKAVKESGIEAQLREKWITSRTAEATAP